MRRMLPCVAAVSAALSLQACSEALDGPAPVLPDPLPGTDLPVAPGLLCKDQLTTELTLSGAAFSPMPYDIPNAPKAALPTVTFQHTRDLRGAPITATADGTVTFHGEPDGINAARLAWDSQSIVRIAIDQAITLASATTGTLTPGIDDVHVVNANGKEDVSVSALAIIPKPSLSALTPGITCLAQGPRTVALAGDTFLRFGSVDANVSVADIATPFVLNGFRDCFDVPHPALPISLCTGADLPLAENAIPVGWPALVLNNPETAACRTEDDIRLRVVAPPTISAFEAPFVCIHESERTVDIVGTGFVIIDSTLPAVTMDGIAIAVTEATDCEALPTQGHDVDICTRLTVTLPMTATTDIRRPTVIVTNPDPAGCSATTSEALVLAPPPTIEDVAPPVLCDDGIDQVLRMSGKHFFVIAGTKPIVTVDLTTLDPARVALSDCIDVTVPGLAVQNCATLDVTISPSMVDGREATIAVQNPAPAGCGDTWEIPVPLVDLPLVTSVEPALVCTDDGSRALRVNGTDILVIDGRLPTVTMGGEAVTVDSAEACEATVIGPVANVTECLTLLVTVPANALVPGDVEVVVTNPTPIACTGVASEVLTAAPPLVIDVVEPDGICNVGEARSVTIVGSGFNRIGALDPVVTLAGQIFVPTDFGNCIPLVVPAGSGLGEAFTCDHIQLLIAPGSLPAGDIEVTVTNPTPDGCTEVATDVFFSVPVPTVTNVAPAEICQDRVTTVTVTGTNFSPAADVWLDRAGYLSVPADAVTFINATTLEVSIDAGLATLVPGLWDVRVENAEGCADTLPAALEIHPTPLVFFVDPPIVYSGITIQATIYLAGLQAPAASIELIGPSEQVIELELTSIESDPNRIRALIPAGLEAGLWDARVTSDIGCTSTTPEALNVTDRLTLTIDDVQPRYVWTGRSTAVTMLSNAGGFLATPRAYLNPKDAPAGTPATNMRAVVFDNATTLTGVVPAGLAPEQDYEVIVINPDGSVGIFDSVRVTADPPPVIEAVVPASFNSNGPTRAAIIGEGFSAEDGVTVSLTCRDQSGNTFGPLAAPVVLTPAAAAPTDVRVSADFPSGQVPAGSICIVTLTNADGTSFAFSAVSTKTPAQNPNPWDLRPDLTTPRRGPASVAGRPTAASRVLYVTGGDTGTRATALATVESSRIDLFGANSNFEVQRHELPSPRTFQGVARVGRFLYVAGGTDGTNTVGTLLRSEVLDPLATPELVDLSIRLVNTEASPGPLPTPTGLAAGIWIYRVSAVFGANDANNPGGESLPGEPVVVQLPAFDGLVLTFTWDRIPGAVGYRVYRTPASGQGQDDVQLLAEVIGGDNTCFEDDGLDVDSDEVPLPAGSLGVWHAVGTGLNHPRERFAFLAASAPDDSGVAYLYAAGGRDATNTVRNDYEVARILVTDAGAMKTRETQTVGAFAVQTATLGAPRADLSAWTLTERDVLTAARGQTWVFFGPGSDQAGGGARNMDAGVIGADGILGYPPDDPRANNEPVLMRPGSLPSSRIAYGAGYASGFFYMFGGNPTAPSGSSDSAQLCLGAGVGGCNPDRLPEVRNWNSAGTSMVVDPALNNDGRAWMGVASESAHFYLIGGANTGANSATNKVEAVVQ